MSEALSKPARPWVKWLAGTLLVLFTLLALLAAGVWFGIRYLASEEVKRFEDVVGLHGGTIEFRSLRIRDIRTFPEVTLLLSQFSLVETGFDEIEDSRKHSRSPERPRLLRIDTLEMPLTVDLWDDPSATIHAFSIRGGEFHVVKLPDGSTNLGRLLGTAPASEDAPGEEIVEERFSPSYLRLGPAAKLMIQRFDVSYLDSTLETHVAGFIEDLCVDDVVLEPEFAASVSLKVAMDELLFKQKQGPFLDDAPVYGQLRIAVADEVLTAYAPSLHLGPNVVEVDTRFYLRRDSVSTIRLAMPESYVARAREILAPEVLHAIETFDVEGRFASVTTIFLPERGAQPTIEIALHLPNNTAKVDRETFYDTYLDARFVNYPADTTGGRKGIRFFVDTVRTTYLGFDMRAADALVTSSVADGLNLRADGTLTGAASAISKAINSDQFLFTRGRMRGRGSVDGDPQNIMALINTASVDAVIEDAVVRLPDVGVSLPFERIDLRKAGDTSTYDIVGTTPDRRRDYRLEGRLLGLGKLLGTSPDAEVAAEVNLTAGRIAWTDVVNILGDVDSPAAAKTDQAKKNAFKSTLTLVKNTFNPDLDIRIDTMSYYGLDIFRFNTGLHFDDAYTVFLERTSFVIDTALVSFAGRLDISPVRRTPFQFSLDAGHLNLASVVPKMDYFGIKLLEELNTLPNDVSVQIRQRGIMDAVDGIVMEQTEGSIRLESNKDLPFSAQIDFEPDRPGQQDFQSTRVALQGSPELFNTFFETEDFFFRQGEFDFRMGYAGLVPDLRTLIDRNAMQLRVTDATIDFRSAGVAVPVDHLDVKMAADSASVDLLITDARLGQELSVRGHARNVSEVVLGGTGKQFSSDLQVHAPRLIWGDINALISSLDDEPAGAAEASAVQFASATAPDTTGTKKQKAAERKRARADKRAAATALDTLGATANAPDSLDTELHLRRTIRAVMEKFEPEVDLRIDEFQLTNALSVRNVESGLRMDADKVLHVDTTGFDYGDGYFDLMGDLDLANLRLTPFAAKINSDELDLASMLEGFEYFNVEQLAEAEQLEAELSLRLDVTGAMTGGRQAATVFDEMTCGTLDLQLRDLTVAGVRSIDEIAAKYKVRKRLDVLKFAPVDVQLTFDGNRVYLPVTEVQSNALTAFIEGDIHVDSVSTVFVSIPLANLKRRDLTEVPARRGFGATRLKVHLEIRSARGQPISTKLRLSKKDFYEAINGEGSWKQQKRAWKRERRAEKRKTKERKVKERKVQSGK